MIEQLKTADMAQTFQRFVKDFVRVLEENPRLDGRFIRGISLVATVPQPIDHKLGRKPVGWEITDIQWAGAVNVMVRRTAWDTTTITLDSPVTDVTLDIWVY